MKKDFPKILFDELENCVFVSLTRKTAGMGERQKAVKESIATAAAKLAFISEGKKCSSKM